MSRKLISQGSEWEAKIGYSRAVVQGDWIFVSGTTGYNYATMEISNDMGEQTQQTLDNIEWALEQAGASLKDVVKVTYMLADNDEFPQCWPALNKAFGDVRPALKSFQSVLANDEIKIEIEVMAYKKAEA